MSKNILFVVHDLKGGGIQKITVDTARYHASIGNKVKILTFKKGQDFTFDFECELEVLPLISIYLMMPWMVIYKILYKLVLRYLFPRSEFIWAGKLYAIAFKRFLKKENNTYDAIFVNGARSMHRLHSCKQENIVFSLHLPYVLSKVERSFYTDFLFKTLFSDKKIFAVSDFIKKPIELRAKELHVSNLKLETIYNPCDKNSLQKLAQKDLDFKPEFIVAVGRLCSQKRFDILIKAYDKSRIDCDLVIVGGGSDSHKNMLEKLIKDLNLEGKVHLVGFDKNPFKWMKRSRFFILSSDIEGFVLVVNEALACGAPVIATDCGPVTEILTGKLSEGIVPKGDIGALAEKIKEFNVSPIYPTAGVVSKLSFKDIINKQLSLI
ncbi:glycosyltransferase [Photobacterium profundum]|uniref:Hypothetical glycosyl transferase n=1 Tax=Photobacterium profundum (strain SS9) TaxID=298386 RepID=Q6LVM1_PHOPR|nr:glycosyltransferase [Photobacterium profundum]CAG18654.1 hypothetical glycosyl transferase [Photobacterium profundum SS9]